MIQKQFYRLAAELVFDSHPRFPSAMTTCKALQKVISGNGYPASYVEEHKILLADFFNDSNGLWYFEGPDENYEEEKEHRILSLLLMVEILNSKVC